MPLDPDQAKFAIIIGAMKSGTSSLFNYLAEHPQICASKTKEPGFFAIDAEWRRGRAWYGRLWPFDPSRHAYALEASTEYTLAPAFPDTVERIASFGTGRFKLIYVMRHPLRRIESQARQAAFTGWKVSSGQEGDDTGFAWAPDDPVYQWAVKISSYALQLDRYLAKFSREQICLLTFEELRDYPEKVLDRVSEFLEIDPFVFLGTDQPHNPSRDYAPHPLWARLMRKRSFTRTVTRILPATIRDRLRKIGSRPLDSRFHLSAEEESKILAELLPDLRRLQDEYGVDVEDVWGISVDGS